MKIKNSHHTYVSTVVKKGKFLYLTAYSPPNSPCLTYPPLTLLHIISTHPIYKMCTLPVHLTFTSHLLSHDTICYSLTSLQNSPIVDIFASQNILPSYPRFPLLFLASYSPIMFTFAHCILSMAFLHPLL